MANFALNYSFSRNLSIPLDEDAVKSTLSEVKEYVRTKSKCYAGQLFSVTGDTTNNGLYIALSKGTEGGVLKLASQDALDAVAASAGKIDEIRLNGNALTINNKVVNINLNDYATVAYVESSITETLNSSKSYVDNKLEDYATQSFVTDKIVSALTNGTIDITGYAKIEDVKTQNEQVFLSGKTYTDNAISASEEKMYWLPVGDGSEKHLVKHWKGSRANYEFLLKNNAINNWTRYVVIDKINNEDIITEYYGTNQVSDHTGQLLPVISIIGNISEITPSPYDRYLVGNDGAGYNIYEYVIDSENAHRWLIKPFDYRYGVRVKSEGLKNFVYFENKLFSYDDVNCGEF
jgi:hypothetical protein